jgi:tetratricopeptide (TPR) repeat protein
MVSGYRLLVIVFLSFGVLCASAQDSNKAKADHFILEGHRQMLLGNNSDAFEMFRHGLMLNPKSSVALSELSHFWQYLRQDSLSLQYMKLATQYAPDNYWNKEALVDFYVDAGKTDDAINVLEQLAKQFPEKEDVLLMLETLYKQKQDYANVVRVLDALEVKEGKSEQLSIEKFRTYVQMKDEKKAFEEMSELAEEYPNDLRYRVLLGDLYVDQGQYDEGLKVYQAVEEEDSTNIYLMSSMLNYYTKTNQDSLYQQQLNKVCTNPQLDEETRLRFLNGLVFQNMQENKDPQPLLEIFKKVLAMPQENTQILELCTRFMVTLKRPADEVKPVLNQMLDINPENNMARGLLLEYAVEANDLPEVIRISKPAVDYSIDDPVFYYYLGVAYFQTDSAQLAVKTFRKGLQKVDSKTNLQLLTNMYALMGDAYHQLGDSKHAYECYDSCLLYRPDEAMVLNNYAYYLSLEEKQLEKAEEMSRRSLEKESDNYTYIDTYAWILFKQKKYTEAKEYIDKALAIMGDDIEANDATIIEHAGDIYAKNGQKERAVEFWQQAVDLGNASVVLKKKLNKKKYINE